MHNLNVYKKRIIELQKMKDFRGAYDLLKAALKDCPADPFLMTSEIYLLLRIGRLKEARHLAERRVEALRHNPFFVRTYLSVLEKAGAKDDIDIALERHVFDGPNRDEDLLSFAAQLIGRVFGRERALDALKRAISLYPGSPVVKELLNNYESREVPLGRYKQYKETFKGKETDDAISEIESVMVLPSYSGDRELMEFLAGLYKKKGDYPGAINLYKRMLAIKDDAFTRKMLGFALHKNGDSDNALVYLRESFLNDPADRYVVAAVASIFKGKGDFDGFSGLIDETLAAHPEARHLYGILKRASSWRKKEEKPVAEKDADSVRDGMTH